MGGLMINGCGAADSFYVLKPLPGHPCTACKKSDLALMEVKRKVRVFYIPTVTVNSKYAVACPKCKNGHYITDEQKEQILRGNPDGLREPEDAAPKSDPAQIPAAPQSKPAQIPPAPKQAASGALCRCGAELPPGTVFCAQCGARVGDPAPVKRTPERLCRCGAALPPTAKFCAQCGTPVSAAPPKIQVETKPPQPQSFAQTGKAPDMAYRRGKVCPECGIRALPGKETCSICGAKLV